MSHCDPQDKSVTDTPSARKKKLRKQRQKQASKPQQDPQPEEDLEYQWVMRVSANIIIALLATS